MLEKFHYTLPDGYNLELPRFENIPAGIIRKTRRMNPADQAFTLLEEFLPENILAEHVDPMPRGDFEAMLSAWQSGSGITPGESSASSTS